MISTVNLNSETAPKEFVKSLRDTGFAVVTGHSIDSDLLDWAYEDWRDFFASDRKWDWVNGPDHSGYFPFKSENAKDSEFKDLKEFYHVYPQIRVPSQVNLVSYLLRNDLVDLASTLLGWIQDNSPNEVRALFTEPLPSMIKDSDQTLLRVLHYPPLGDDAEPQAVRAAAHEDINLITLLPAATQPGLQVKDANGSWVEVPCDPGSVIVNVGDMLEIASNKYFKSTSHRVVNPIGDEAKKSRYSMPLFLHPRPEVMLAKDLTARDALAQRLAEIMRKK